PCPAKADHSLGTRSLHDDGVDILGHETGLLFLLHKFSIIPEKAAFTSANSVLRYAVTTLLPKPPQLPSPDELASQLRAVLTDWAEVQWCASTGSTNTDLLQAVKAGAPAPRLLGTHLQEQGRGRAGRSF